MLKVRLNCPLCGQELGVRSLEGHLENVHELTGTVTLRLNPTHPFTCSLALEPVAELEVEPEKEPEVEPAAEPEVEPAAEPEETLFEPED